MNVNQAIRERRSVRKYKPITPTRQELTEVMEAARLAPTACNKQPFRLVCVTSDDMLGKLKAAYDREWLKTASCIIVVIADHSQSWHRGQDGKDHADIDAAIATDHMTLRATEIGLSTCWICNFDAAMVHKDMGLGDTEEAVVLLPIGYADDEAKPKTRKAAESTYEFQ